MILSSCYPKKLDQESTHFSSLMNPLTTPPTPANGNNNSNLALQLSPYSSSSSTSFFDHSHPTNSIVPLAIGSKSCEISSNQSPPGSTTPHSSYTNGVDELMRTSNMINDYYRDAPEFPHSNSGLLDAVMMEAKKLSNNNNGKSKSEGSTFASNKLSCKRKSMALEEYGGNEDENFTAFLLESTTKKHTKDTTLDETQTGKKVASEEALVEMNSMDDDLLSLLNNFPSQSPTPEWYRSSNQSLGLETQATNNASTGPTDQEFAWPLGSGWMPGLC